MVLDLSLPKRDGIQVLEAMRGRFENTSVLVLTGRSQVEERVHCLNLGADDCLLKPFSFHELVARCRAILRRSQRPEDPHLRFGGIEMNRLSRTVSREGTPIDLTPREFELLQFLLQRQGACCSRSEVLSEVWGVAPDAGTNVVDVYINYLRRKLAAALPSGQEDVAAIETVRGMGYRLRPQGAVSPAPVPVRSPGASQARMAQGA